MTSIYDGVKREIEDLKAEIETIKANAGQHLAELLDEIARLVIENKHLHRVIRAIAIERVLLVRGSDDVPGFEACVQAEIACIEGQDA
jgi:regulator of replication initiation timing